MANRNDVRNRRRMNVRTGITRREMLRRTGMAAAGVGAAAVGLGGVAHATGMSTHLVNPGIGTLSAAIYAANEGDRLLLAPGTYDETDPLGVIVDKSLTIEGKDGRNRPQINLAGNWAFGPGWEGPYTDTDIWWNLQNLEINTPFFTVVQCGNFKANNCSFNQTYSQLIPGIALFFWNGIMGSSEFGDVYLLDCEFTGFMGLSLGEFAPPNVSNFNSSVVMNCSFDTLFTAISAENATYKIPPVFIDNDVAGSFGIYIGRGQYDGAVVKGNTFTVVDRGWYAPLGVYLMGFYGVCIDETHISGGEEDYNPDGKVVNTIVQGNKVLGTGLYGIAVYTGSGNIFVGNNLQNFNALVAPVMFGSPVVMDGQTYIATNNVYVGNANLVVDEDGGNIFKGVGKVLHELNPDAKNRLADAMSKMRAFKPF